MTKTEKGHGNMVAYMLSIAKFNRKIVTKNFKHFLTHFKLFGLYYHP